MTALSFLSQSGLIWSASMVSPTSNSHHLSAAPGAQDTADVPIVTTSAALLLTLFRLIFSCAFGAIPGPTLSSTSSECVLRACEKPDAPAVSGGEMANADVDGRDGVDAVDGLS